MDMDKRQDKLLAKPNETIKEHTDKLIKQAEILKSYGYITNEGLFADLLSACKFHDRGKENSRFQKRIKYHTKFNPTNELPHNILSLYYVDKTQCVDYVSVCFAVLYHHYHSESPEMTIINKKDLVQEILVELFGSAEKYNSLRRCRNEIGKLFSLSLADEKKKYAVLLKGFLHKCDYSASAHIQCEYPNDFLLECVEDWKEGRGIWKEREGLIEYNELQKFCAENRGKNIIVTAPTGMGKTEAGLLWCGNNKCFYVLPLKTAINAMYDRISLLTNDKAKTRVVLIHSDMKSKYSEICADNPDGVLDLDYCKRSKQMSLPLTVCTPDQIFDFVLKYPGYEYKLATASYSRFIIDEIQMYSADLLAAIIYAINLIYTTGGKFAILTATLPPFVRKELVKIFGDDISMRDFSSFGILRHSVKVEDNTLTAKEIYSKIEGIQAESVKKYLVVCNSIDIANQVYSELKKLLSGTAEVNLFHSRFIKMDRAEKERAILDASKDRAKTEVWVSTSVVEASLDIDFDVLFTELSDLFSLFQRFGRVNRKGKKDYFRSNPNCYVFTQRQGNALRYHFTDDTIYELSKQAIMTVDGIITEEEKTKLIDEYLSAERIEKSEYYDKYKRALDELEKNLDYLNDKSESLRTIDRIDVIPGEVYDANKGIIQNAAKIACDKTLSPIERLNASGEIMKYSVSISKYRAKSERITDKIYIGYSEIPVFRSCTYSSEEGMLYSNEEIKNSEPISQVSSTDNFL
ncbi:MULTISPECIES: CRISPR-associated helicase Cas3' [unclassified Ruminococcus]|uniref:CRISPR-associated helicase Cas3' n=1 Tax=unclassified Ruminococcus TaxID=2608920 RepID=UPI002109B859|nr:MULTISPECIES: CRISPR-associated helicase Cas3' [unclassified Ruminococcus]